MSARGVLRILEGNRIGFWCSGCQEMHVVRVSPAPQPWDFNGDYDRPTFTPSVLVTGRRITEAGEAQYQAWANAGMPRPAPTLDSAETRCHSFVRDGQIQYLSDCDHALAGKMVQLQASPV